MVVPDHYLLLSPVCVRVPYGIATRICCALVDEHVSSSSIPRIRSCLVCTADLHLDVHAILHSLQPCPTAVSMPALPTQCPNLERVAGALLSTSYSEEVS